MAIVVQCSACGAKFQVDDSYAGYEAECYRCNSVLTIPGGARPPARSAPHSYAGPPAAEHGVGERSQRQVLLFAGGAVALGIVVVVLLLTTLAGDDPVPIAEAESASSEQVTSASVEPAASATPEAPAPPPVRRVETKAPAILPATAGGIPETPPARADAPVNTKSDEPAIVTEPEKPPAADDKPEDTSKSTAETRADLAGRLSRGVVLITVQDERGRDVSLGTGLVLNETGLIATNYHVVDQATKAKAEFRDGTVLPIAGYRQHDPGSDLALLQIVEALPSDIEILQLSDTDPRPGSEVIAIGHPSGFKFTVSTGIVSAVHSTADLPAPVQEFLSAPNDNTWIQTSAPISPGSSGGPLFNYEGQVIGLNTWVAGGSNLGFASHVRHLKALIEKAESSSTVEPLSRYRRSGPRRGGGDEPIDQLLSKLASALDDAEQMRWEPQNAGDYADLQQLAVLATLASATDMADAELSAVLNSISRVNWKSRLQTVNGLAKELLNSPDSFTGQGVFAFARIEDHETEDNVDIYTMKFLGANRVCLVVPRNQDYPEFYRKNDTCLVMGICLGLVPYGVGTVRQQAAPGIGAGMIVKVENGLAVLPPALRQEIERLPAPATTEIAEAEQLVQEIYGREIEAAEKPSDFISVGEKLLEQAQSPENASASRFALFQKAAQMAVRGGNTALAMRALKGLGARFEVEVVPMKLAALQQIAGEARFKSVHRAVAKTAVELIDEAIEADLYSAAEQAGRIATAAAEEAGDSFLPRIITERLAAVEEGKGAYAAVAAAKEQLARDPEDAAANTLVGRHLCFQKNDWQHGLKHLRKGDDQVLKNLAEKEAAPPADAEGQTELGDAWWDAAETADEMHQAEYRQRAAHWYESALPQLSGLKKVKVQQRLDSLE